MFVLLSRLHAFQLSIHMIKIIIRSDEKKRKNLCCLFFDRIWSLLAFSIKQHRIFAGFFSRMFSGGFQGRQSTHTMWLFEIMSVSTVLLGYATDSLTLANIFLPAGFQFLKSVEFLCMVENCSWGRRGCFRGHNTI